MSPLYGDNIHRVLSFHYFRMAETFHFILPYSYSNISSIQFIYCIRSSVGIATDYGLDDRGSNPGGVCEFYSLTPCQDRLWGSPNLNGYRGLFTWGKVAGA
jgi:hypothetical protein